jgi:hypothetical protein
MKKLHKGSTLVECIAAIILLSFSALILLTGVLAAVNVSVRADELKAACDSAKITIEADTEFGDCVLENEAETNITFEMGATIISAKGRFKNAKCGEVFLTAFASSGFSNEHIIPDTGIPVNGSWPPPEDFIDEYGYAKWLIVPKGTTLFYDGIFYIATGDLNVGLSTDTPLPTNGWWYNNNGTGLAVISERPVIVWNGGTSTEFFSATGGHITIGDKVLWNGNYYVFTIKNQTWANPPDISQKSWERIVA